MKNNNYFSISHRLLHWSIALVILFILLTVFLRMGWMEKKHMADLIIISAAKFDIFIAHEIAIKVAKSIRNVMFEWHIYASYLLCGLLVLRLINLKIDGISYKSPFSKTSTFREKFQAWIYISFYTIMGLVLVTGLLLKFGPQSIEDIAKNIHELALWYFIPFIIIHFVGIILAEHNDEKGIVSKMIGG